MLKELFKDCFNLWGPHAELRNIWKQLEIDSLVNDIRCAVFSSCGLSSVKTNSPNREAVDPQYYLYQLIKGSSPGDYRLDLFLDEKGVLIVIPSSDNKRFFPLEEIEDCKQLKEKAGDFLVEALY